MKEEAEIVALLFVFPEEAPRILSMVSSDKFVENAYLAAAVEVFEAMRDKGAIIKEKSVYRALEEEFGKEAADIVNDEVLSVDPELDNLEIYASKVLDNWTRHQLIKLSGEFSAVSVAEAEDTSEFIGARIQHLNEILQRSALEEEQAAGLVQRAIDEIYERVKDGEEDFTLTGLPSVDGYLKFSKFDLTILQGPSKSGKTALASGIVDNCVRQKIPFFYVSGELDAETLVKKYIGFRHDIPTDLLNTKDIKEEKTAAGKAVRKSIEELKGIPGAFIGSHDLSLGYVVKMCHYYKIKYGTRHFILDRVDLFKEVTSSQDEFGAIRMITRTLRNLARKLEANIILVFQSGNAALSGAKGRAQAHHVWGGTAAQADSTRMISVFNPYARDKTLKKFQAGPFADEPLVTEDGKYYYAEISVLLNTIGGTGSAKVAFSPDIQKFYDLGITSGRDVEATIEQKRQRYEEGGYIFNPGDYNQPVSTEDFEAIPNPKVDDDDDPFPSNGSPWLVNPIMK